MAQAMLEGKAPVKFRYIPITSNIVSCADMWHSLCICRFAACQVAESATCEAASGNSRKRSLWPDTLRLYALTQRENTTAVASARYKYRPTNVCSYCCITRRVEVHPASKNMRLSMHLELCASCANQQSCCERVIMIVAKQRAR